MGGGEEGGEKGLIDLRGFAAGKKGMEGLRVPRARLDAGTHNPSIPFLVVWLAIAFSYNNDGPVSFGTNINVPRAKLRYNEDHFTISGILKSS